jgi:flagellin
MLAIRNNMMAKNAARSLGLSYGRLATSVQRLSSGLRINTAKDDAAGLAVRELIRADVAKFKQGSRNARDGVSLLQTAEGALGEIDAILIRMRELAEQACTDTYSDTQKGIMQAEFDELGAEITRIAETTDFNDISLLDSNTGTVKVGLGGGVANIDRCILVTKEDLRAESLGLIGQREMSTLTSTAAPTLTDRSDTLVTNQATDAQTFTFTFAGTEYSTSMASGASLTLQGVVDLVNGVSTGVARVDNDASGNLQLVLKHTETGDQTDIDLTSNSTSIEWGTGTGTSVGTVNTIFTTVDGSDNLDLKDGDDTAIHLIEEAIEKKDSFRASLGYLMNRLEYASKVLDTQAENLTASESRISDVDVASEMSVLTRNQVLSQAGIAMLSQANSMPQMALSLLQG